MLSRLCRVNKTRNTTRSLVIRNRNIRYYCRMNRHVRSFVLLFISGCYDTEPIPYRYDFHYFSSGDFHRARTLSDRVCHTYLGVFSCGSCALAHRPVSLLFMIFVLFSQHEHSMSFPFHLIVKNGVKSLITIDENLSFNIKVLILFRVPGLTPWDLSPGSHLHTQKTTFHRRTGK